MYIPLVRERVQVRNRSGEFLVLWVDYVRKVAAVREVEAASVMEEQVPFTEFFALWEIPTAGPAPAARARRGHSSSQYGQEMQEG